MKYCWRHDSVQTTPLRWRLIAVEGLHKVYFHSALWNISAAGDVGVALKFEIMRGRQVWA